MNGSDSVERGGGAPFRRVSSAPTISATRRSISASTRRATSVSSCGRSGASASAIFLVEVAD
jgi:hypothetical protein